MKELVSRREWFRLTGVSILTAAAILEAACRGTQEQPEANSFFPSSQITPEFFNPGNLQKIVDSSRVFLEAKVINTPGEQKLWYILPNEMRRNDEILNTFGIESIAIGVDGSEQNLAVQFSFKDFRHKVRVQRIPYVAFILDLEENSPKSIAASDVYTVVADGRNLSFMKAATFIFPVSLSQLNGDFVFIFNKDLLNNSENSAALLPLRFHIINPNSSRI